MNSTIKILIGTGLFLLAAVSVWIFFNNSNNSEPSAPASDQARYPEATIPPLTQESPAFVNTIWTATSIENNALVEGTTATIQFDEQNKVSGSDGCNTFSTSYAMEGSDLIIDGAMVSTQIACEEDVMTQADAFTGALLATTSYVLGDGVLVLNQGDVSGLTFVGQSNSLGKTSWNVTGYNNGNQAVVSPLLDTTVTMTFGDDGTISGNSGCNNFSGQYSLNGQSITISPLATTLIECIEPEGIMEQETAFLDALQNAVLWQMQGNQLSLRTAADELAVTAISSFNAPTP